ncbi:GNAT family N-acetyltransferase [Erythrobacter arachoides]|uniref:GNAT family N-acetyltransferase n=1 Tax=Aurantiacibacter arachoides TaxID=1850444 RepID=A0A844ZXK9_9SPHN|nr:GNAT family N-acetyltransferase [Aurantiacibacter arachoides]MXO93031.1 GNAT family N-acetyltransferase [Aurantiacibacter arachoides]
MGPFGERGQVTAISYHDTVNDLQGRVWSDQGPFARPAWFRLLEESGLHPFIAVVREGDEAMALPLHRRGGRLEALTNWYAFDWRPLRTANADDDALLPALARALLQQTHRLDLAKLPEEDGWLPRLEAAFGAAGWFIIRQPCDTNHILPVASRSYQKYLDTRPGPLRTTLKRKAKKVEAVVVAQFHPADWEAYEAIYASSWKPAEGDPALLRRFAEAESAAGRYRFALARHQGEPVAAQFWTVDGATAYIHKLAHRDSAAALSPGTTLTAALMQRVIDVDQVEQVDFGTGDDRYKRDWMEAQRTRWHLTCLRPTDPRNWPAIARHLLRTLVSRNAAG